MCTAVRVFRTHRMICQTLIVLVYDGWEMELDGSGCCERISSPWIRHLVQLYTNQWW